VRIVDDEEQAIGRPTAEVIRSALIEQNLLDADGRIQAAFDPKRLDFKLDLPEELQDLAPAVVDVLASYQLERHIRRQRDERPNRLNKEVYLSPEFRELWDRIKPRTTYRVEFETDQLVNLALAGIRRMEKIEPPKITISTGQVSLSQ